MGHERFGVGSRMFTDALEDMQGRRSKIVAVGIAGDTQARLPGEQAGWMGSGDSELGRLSEEAVGG